MADTIITVTIREANWPKVRQGYLKQRPIPTDPATQQPTMTPKKWIAVGMKDWLQRMALSGLKRVAEEAVVDDVTVDAD